MEVYDDKTMLWRSDDLKRLQRNINFRPSDYFTITPRVSFLGIDKVLAGVPQLYGFGSSSVRILNAATGASISIVEDSTSVYGFTVAGTQDGTTTVVSSLRFIEKTNQESTLKQRVDDARAYRLAMSETGTRTVSVSTIHNSSVVQVFDTYPGVDYASYELAFSVRPENVPPHQIFVAMANSGQRFAMATPLVLRTYSDRFCPPAVAPPRSPPPSPPPPPQPFPPPPKYNGVISVSAEQVPGTYNVNLTVVVDTVAWFARIYKNIDDAEDNDLDYERTICSQNVGPFINMSDVQVYGTYIMVVYPLLKECPSDSFEYGQWMACHMGDYVREENANGVAQLFNYSMTFTILALSPPPSPPPSPPLPPSPPPPPLPPPPDFVPDAFFIPDVDLRFYENNKITEPVTLNGIGTNYAWLKASVMAIETPETQNTPYITAMFEESQNGLLKLVSPWTFQIRITTGLNSHAVGAKWNVVVGESYTNGSLFSSLGFKYQQNSTFTVRMVDHDKVVDQFSLGDDQTFVQPGCDYFFQPQNVTVAGLSFQALTEARFFIDDKTSNLTAAVKP